MSEQLNEESARAALKRADDLIEDVVGGVVNMDREDQALSEADVLLNQALTFYRGEGNTHHVAVTLESMAYMERHGRANIERARALFLEAAELFEQVGDAGERIAALLELGEMDPRNAKTQEAVDALLRTGLSEDPHHTEDPARLADAKWRAGDADGALALYDALVNEALTRDSKARAARLLRDVARIHEDGKRDKVAAADTLERALKLAEEGSDKDEIGAALLRLTDIWVERNKPKVARDYFERVVNMRGLPSWQKKLIGPMRMYFS